MVGKCGEGKGKTLKTVFQFLTVGQDESSLPSKEDFSESE